MKIRTFKIVKIASSAICAVALLGATNVWATAYTSTNGGGNWNANTSWTPSGVPGSGDTAAIAATAPVSVSDTEAALSITIQKGATLTIGTGGTLAVGGTITQSGGSSGAATLTLSGGSGTLNLGAAATSFSGVTLVSGTAGSTVNYTASGSTVYTNAYDNLTLSGGGNVTYNNSPISAINLVMSGSTALTNASGKLVSITGNMTLNNTSIFAVNGNTTTTIGGNLTLNGSSIFYVSAATTVSGNFTVNTGCSYLNNNGNSTLSIGGNVFVAGTFGFASGAGNGSTVTLSGANMTVSGGGTLTNQVLNVTGTYTLQAGTTIYVGNKNAGDGPLGGSGSLTNQGTLGLAYTTALSTALAITTLDCSTIGNTLVLSNGNGGGTSILRALPYYNLTLIAGSGASAFNLGSIGTVGGNLTFSGSSGAAALVTAWPASPSIGGQVVFNSTKGITFPATSCSVGGLSQTAGTVTVPSGCTLAGGTGTFTTSAGTLVLGGCTIDGSAFSVSSGAILTNTTTATSSMGAETTLNSVADFTAVGGASSAIGEISVTGDLALNANAITIDVTGSSSLAVGDYPLMACTGTLSGSANSPPTIVGKALASGYTDAISTTAGSGGHFDLIVNATPTFSGLTSQSVTYGTASVTLSGTVSSTSGPTTVYAASGDPVTATINGITVTGYVSSSGFFTITYNDPSLVTDPAGSSYPVTYAYAGNSAAFLNAAANNTSTLLNVIQAPATVTAIAQSKTYGDVLATFGSGSTLFTSSTLSNGETIGTVTLACSGGPANSPAGPYAITPSAATGGSGTEANYNITYLPGTLTVSALPVVLTGTQPYDGTSNVSAAVLTISNNLDGPNLGITGSGTLAGSSVGGPYAITDFGSLTLTGPAAGNYTLTGSSSAVTIVLAVPTVTCPSDITDTNAADEDGNTESFEATTNDTGGPTTLTYTIPGPITITSPYFFPTGTTVVTATVTNAAGTNSCTFNVIISAGSSAPVITSIVPNFGSTNGGTFVTINGANFLSGPTVTFGALSANAITYVNSSQITVTTPAQPPGQVTVTVTDTDSQTATGSYTYVLPPPPATASISSSSGNLTMVWTGGTNESCLLMSTPDLTLPLSNWTVVTTNVVDGSGLSTNIIPINPTQPQLFYELTVPYN